MKILPLCILLACVVCSFAQDEEPRPVVARGLLKRGPLAKGKATTTTTTPAPQDDAEYEDEAEYPAEDNQEPSTEAPPSSTEGKKLVGSGVRPFRSNTDLLETLKRRRAQAAEAKLHGNSAPAASTQDFATEAPAKSSYAKKRGNTATREVSNDDAPPAAKPSRGRFGRPSSSRAAQDPEVEEQNDAAPPSRSSRFSRRN